MTWTAHDPIRVATHGCPHHLDELVAVCLLQHWARGRSLEAHFLARSELAGQAASFDVLIDIGGEFDPPRGRFDHHQATAEVAGRSAAGLIFDTMYADDPRRSYLEPIIRQVDAIDCGTRASADDSTAAPDRGRAMISVPALLKAVGGFEHNPAASHRCLDLVAALVDSWMRQADAYRQAADVVAAAQRVGRGIFLSAEGLYGPGLLEYVQRHTEFAFIGFPAGPDRFHVVAMRGPDGDNRVTFPPGLAGATFVHAKGYLAVFPDHEAARIAQTHRVER